MARHHGAHSPDGEAGEGAEETAEGNRPRQEPQRLDLPVDPDVPEEAVPPAPPSAWSAAGRVLRERWDILLVISAGGAVGSLARWGVAEMLPYGHDAFAWPTWLVNVTGAFVLGMLMVFILDVWPTTRYVRPFLGVGVLGGYTTFSTYMLDTRMLLSGGHLLTAFGYLFGTLAAGLVAVWAGVLSARAVAAAVERRHRHHDRHHDRHRDTVTEDRPPPSAQQPDPTHAPPSRSTR